jgi:phosphate uptake regulator
MIRKVIKQGHNTLTITLPSKWIEQQGIKAGDEIEITERDNSLLINRGGSVKEQKRLKLDLRGLNYRIIEGHLVIAYKSGYDEIEVLFGDTKTFKLIQTIIMTRLAGYEIIEQYTGSCLVKNISNLIESEFSTMLRRNFLILLSIMRNSYEKIKEGNYESLGELQTLTETSDKFYSFCHRLIITNKVTSGAPAYFYYIILWVIDKISDLYRDMSVILMSQKKSKTPIPAKTMQAFERVNGLIETYQAVFYKYNLDAIVELSENQEKLVNEIRPMLKTGNDAERVILEHLLFITKRVDDLISSCIGLHMNGNSAEVYKPTQKIGQK